MSGHVILSNFFQNSKNVEVVGVTGLLLMPRFYDWDAIWKVVDTHADPFTDPYIKSMYSILSHY